MPGPQNHRQTLKSTMVARTEVDGEGHVNKEQFVQACRKARGRAGSQRLCEASVHQVGYMKDAGVLFEIMRTEQLTLLLLFSNLFGLSMVY